TLRLSFSTALLAPVQRNAAVGAFDLEARAAAVQPSFEAAPRLIADRFDSEPVGIDAAVADARRDRGLRLARQPYPDAAVRALQLHAAFRHLREIDVEAAVGRARDERARDVARLNAAVGRLGVDPSLEAGHLDPAMDRFAFDLGARRRAPTRRAGRTSATRLFPPSGTRR